MRNEVLVFEVEGTGEQVLGLLDDSPFTTEDIQQVLDDFAICVQKMDMNLAADLLVMWLPVKGQDNSAQMKILSAPKIQRLSWVVWPLVMRRIEPNRIHELDTDSLQQAGWKI